MVSSVSANNQNSVLYAMSVNKALNDKDTKKQKRITKGLFYAAPVVDSVVFAALTASGTKSLAKTMGNFGSRLGIWALLLGFYELASKGIDKLTHKSKTLSKLRKEKPEIKTLLDIGALYGGFRLADEMVNKGLNNIPANFIKMLSEKKEAIAKSVDSSKIAKNIFTPAVENTKSFMAKHVKLASGMKEFLPGIASLLVLGSIIKGAVFDSSRLQGKIAENYMELKDRMPKQD